MNGHPTVCVFHPIGVAVTPCALPLKVCRDVVDAHVLAHAIRHVFKCPTWIEDFERPANVMRIADRQKS
jgi:hypothetical protein